MLWKYIDVKGLNEDILFNKECMGKDYSIDQSSIIVFCSYSLHQVVVLGIKDLAVLVVVVLPPKKLKN